MDRIEKVREIVDSILGEMTDDEERKSAYIHLYGVAQAAALIAKKRNENIELSIVAAMLHDISTYKNGDSTDHAHQGAIIAKEILRECNLFSREEMELICSAIYHHSDKEIIGESFDEILKDADVMQHIFYNPFFKIKDQELKRFHYVKNEFGIIN